MPATTIRHVTITASNIAYPWSDNLERTFSSMPFIGGHFTMRLAAMTKGHRAMKTGIGDIAASASLLNKNSFTRYPCDTFYDEARCVFLLMRTCPGSQRTHCVSLGMTGCHRSKGETSGYKKTGCQLYLPCHEPASIGILPDKISCRQIFDAQGRNL